MKVEELIAASKKFLIDFVKGEECPYEVVHPWRKRWEYTVMHCFRVESYANKILAIENFNLSQKEIITIRMAAILHDIGRIDNRENHGEYGAHIISDWIKDNKDIKDSGMDKEKLLAMIKDHSNKKEPEKDICSAILKDADILDEIGVMSIFMASNWVDKSSPYFFNELLERVEKHEIPFCEKAHKMLNTNAAKQILSQREKYINNFITQLKDELEGSFEAIEEIGSN